MITSCFLVLLNVSSSDADPDSVDLLLSPVTCIEVVMARESPDVDVVHGFGSKTRDNLSLSLS